MREDKLPEQSAGAPAREPERGDRDILRRAAREIRASSSPSLHALVPLSPAEREQLADGAIEIALGPSGASRPSACDRRIPADSIAAATR